MSLELVCLGVGMGASYVMRGLPSTAFALLVDDVPSMLIDCGNGVVRSCLRHVGALPGTVYFTHNHTDHTGDLPHNFYHTLQPPRALGHQTVLDYILQHRLHDAPAKQQQFKDQVEWVAADAQNVIALPEWGLSLHLCRSRHAYTTYGFVMYQGDRAVLGYTADSGYDEAIYARVTAAPVALVDGRDEGSSEHAALTDVDAYGPRVPDCSIYVVHYEHSAYRFRAPNVQYLHEGDRLALVAGT